MFGDGRLYAIFSMVNMQIHSFVWYHVSTSISFFLPRFAIFSIEFRQPIWISYLFIYKYFFFREQQTHYHHVDRLLYTFAAVKR